MNRDRAVVVALIAAAGSVFASPALADGDALFEVAEDGAVIATPEADARPTGWIAPNATPNGRSSADTIPFGTTPDQAVNLRRQIGGVQIADMDNDGNNDLVAVVYISNAFPPYTEFQDQIFYGNGAGIALTPGWLSDDAIHTGDVQVADINDDGFLDIVAIHGGGLRSDNVRVYFGAAGGPSTSAGYVSVSSPNAWATAGVLVDIDRDGDLDLATTNQGLTPDPFRPNFIYRNNGSTFFTQPSWISADVAVQNGVAAGDVNGDGLIDLAVAKRTNGVPGVYLGTASGLPELTPSIEIDPMSSAAGDVSRGALLTDFDGDNDAEVFFNGDPGRTFDVAPPLLVPDGYATNPPFNGPQETRQFDVDQDGDLDLAEVHFSDGRAHIYLNRNGVLDSTPSWTYDASAVGTSLAFGDLNNDCEPDLVVSYAGDPSILVFFAASPCPGDTNSDNAVTALDISNVLGTFGTSGAVGPCEGDLNGDGSVTALDISIVLSNFGSICP